MTLATPSLAPMRDGAAPLPRPLTAAELAKAPPRLRQAAQEFEAQALARLLQPAFATLDAGRSAFGGGAAEAQWRPMLVEAIAAKAVRAGQGLGLSDLVLRELLRRQAAHPPEETRP
ncbi:rod-binding protein [Roseicella aerolata]|uniref:Rod-binding protein n=1 Tax=Roseicella aerolata TaxID=2883479 RepID=A0A9X1LAL0_9PROT|nr:rod-binding protein [Roseicella aerolata]MCB4822323.1 rod-binding protein [Roseicella aerolata]